MSKISVIVPVYNATKYLHRCIDSILSQTFTDFELLIINDGSIDNSGEICDDYAAKDNRVHVYHKENGGASTARNLGLDNATGEWVVFVDSDDWVECDYLKCLYDGRFDGFVMSSYIYERENVITYETLCDEIINWDTENLVLFLMKGASMTPISKLFKREIILSKGIRFNCRLSSREDTLFVWTYLLYVDQIRTVKAMTYHYCITNDGLSHKRISIEESIYSLDCFYGLLTQFKNKYKGIDISYRHIWLVDEIFKKVVVEEVCENMNLFHRKMKLHEILKSQSVKILLRDKMIVPKGVKRKIWDFLALNQYEWWLALYTYIYKYI